MNAILKNQIKNASLMQNSFERIALKSLLYSLGVLALLYLLFLGIMVDNIVERRNLEARARVLAGEVGNLELVYLSVSNEIDLELSYAMGFQEVRPTFTTRKSLSLGNTDFGESFGNLTTSQNGL